MLSMSFADEVYLTVQNLAKPNLYLIIIRLNSFKLETSNSSSLKKLAW